MSIKRLGSAFRPAKPIGQAIFEENSKLVQSIDRRNMLRGSLTLGALTMLTGCDIGHDGSIQSALRVVSEFNDDVQSLLFRNDHLAPTYTVDQVVKPPHFNAFYDPEDVRPVAAASWKLELAGRISNKTPWTVSQMYDLPETEIIIKHICVEGWDYIGQWSGPSFKLFLEKIGADTKAKYIAFKCFDDYYGSIDMATALHPQTILATKYAGVPIADPYGFPLRLRTATKLGYKNPKWITSIEVTNDKPGGYWEDRGFNWFGGI